MPVRGTDNGRPSYVVIRTSGKLYTNDIVVVLGIRRLVQPDAGASAKRLKFTRAHKIVVQICALVPGLPVGGGWRRRRGGVGYGVFRTQCARAKKYASRAKLLFRK